MSIWGAHRGQWKLPAGEPLATVQQHCCPVVILTAAASFFKLFFIFKNFFKLLVKMPSDQRHECLLLSKQNVTGQRYFSVHLYNKQITYCKNPWVSDVLNVVFVMHVEKTFRLCALKLHPLKEQAQRTADLTDNQISGWRPVQM